MASISQVTDQCEDTFDGWITTYKETSNAYLDDKESLDFTSSIYYKRGVYNFDRFLDFIFVDVGKKYPLSSLQFSYFMRILPMALPIFFGIPFFLQSKHWLWKNMGLPHNKIFIWLVGCRRDGKTILASMLSIGFALYASDTFSSIYVPIFGPSETTGKNFLSILTTLIKDPDIRSGGKYEEASIFTGGKHIKMDTPEHSAKFEVRANTDASRRGINAKPWEVKDESEFAPYESFDKYDIPRYKEEGVASLNISTLNPAEPKYQRLHKSTEVTEYIDNPRFCEDCLNSAEEGTDYKELEQRCLQLGHVKPDDSSWKANETTVSIWNTFHTASNLAQESQSVVIKCDDKVFHEPTVNKLLSNTFPTPQNGFTNFVISSDPAGLGSSKNAYWVFGTSGITNPTFAIITGEEFSSGNVPFTKETLPERIVDVILTLFKKGLLFDSTQQRVYIFAESVDGSALLIEQNLIKHKLNHVARTMKTITKGKNFGTAVPKGLKEIFFNTLTRLIHENKIRLWQHFFARANTVEAKDNIILTLKQQLLAMRRDGVKISGKAHGKNDDLVLAIGAGPTWTLRSIDAINYPYIYNQLHF